MSAKAPAKTSLGKGVRAKPAVIYSTSEARANFAEALEAARSEGAVIGFDRYGHTVAALVPLEAIYILAGRGDHVAPEVRERIERSARNLVQDILDFEPQPKGETRGEKSRKPAMRSGYRKRRSKS